MRQPDGKRLKATRASLPPNRRVITPQEEINKTTLKTLEALLNLAVICPRLDFRHECYRYKRRSDDCSGVSNKKGGLPPAPILPHHLLTPKI